MNAKLLSLFALISFVTAQGPGADDTTSGAATPSASGGAATPSGAAQLPQCVLDCVTDTATAQGCDPTATACVCSAAFQTAATQCVSNCTPEEQAAAIQLQQQTCAAGAGGASGSASASGSAAVTGSATILPTTAPGPISVSSRPAGASSGALSSASVTKPASSGSATGSAAAPSTTNGAASLAAQGVWAMAAGVLGIAVAL